MRTTIKATYMGALLLALASGGAYASVDAGRVQFVFGNSRALAANGVERALKKGDVVHEGDTVITGPSASLQLLMIDDAMVAVRPNSRLRIDTYRFQGKEDGSERGVLHLIKGAFRSITGAIGHTNKKNYKIITDTANIGVRGTDHEPAYVPPSQAKAGEPGTYDLVNAGGTYIQTPWGSVDVSPNQVGFASSEPGSVPVLLQGVPGFLRASPPMAKDADASGSDQPERVVGLDSDNPASLEEPWLNSSALSYLTDPTVVTTDLTPDDVNFNVAGVYGDVSSGVAHSGSFDSNEMPFAKFMDDTAVALAATSPGDDSKLIYNRATVPTVTKGTFDVDGTTVNWGIYGTGTAVNGHTINDRYTSGAPRKPDYMEIMGALATPEAMLTQLSASYSLMAQAPIIESTGAGTIISDPNAPGGLSLTKASIGISNGYLDSYSIMVGVTGSAGTWSGGWSNSSCGGGTTNCVSLQKFASSGVALSGSSPTGASLVSPSSASGQAVGPTGNGMISSFSMQDGTTAITGSFVAVKQ